MSETCTTTFQKSAVHHSSKFVAQQSRDDAMLALHAPPSIAGWLGGGGVKTPLDEQKGAQAEVAEPR